MPNRMRRGAGRRGANVVPHSAAYGISANGSVIIGNAQSDRGDEAFRYDVATQQMTPLGSLSQTTFGAYARAVAGDGSAVVGLSYSAPGEYQA